MVERYTRRKFLKLAGLSTASLSLAAVVGCEVRGNSSEAPNSKSGRAAGNNPPTTEENQYVQAFRSRPDLNPPTIEVVTPARNTAPGHIFLAPKKGEGQYGSMIVDDQGQMLWFKPVDREGDYAMDCKVQSYKGETVLTFWEGLVTSGYGLGEYRLLNTSYEEIGRVRSDGYKGDHHDFQLTERGTALFTIYNRVGVDLSSLGRLEDDAVMEGVVQEVDVETGEVVFEWHSLDHVGVEESYGDTSNTSAPFDYFHINSIDVDDDDNLLVSARKTSAVYKIDRETGEVIWRLDGKKSDFQMTPDSQTDQQHDARRQPDGTITIFDNGNPTPGVRSSGVVLTLNMDEMTAELVREYHHPENIFAESQANMQMLPNGNVFVGWGSLPVFSEFNHDGEMLYSANLPPETQSYRAYRFPWSGRPTDKPAVASEIGPDDEKILYVSWNGATQVAEWQVLAGPEPGRLNSVKIVPRAGFETDIRVSTKEPYVSVRGRDTSKRVLGESEAIEL